jgi:hypothetical protein
MTLFLAAQRSVATEQLFRRFSSEAYMAWELNPPPEVKPELDHMGQIEFLRLRQEVRGWIEEGDGEDLPIARAIVERGHSEELAWWLVKETRMEMIEKDRK